MASWGACGAPEAWPHLFLARVRSAQDPVAGEDVGSDEEYEEDMEEDIVDRDTLKKQAMSILDKEAKKTKKRRSKKGGE